MKPTMIRTTPRRATGALVAGATVLLSIALAAGPAQAATPRHGKPTPAPVPTSTPAPAPAPATAPIAVTGAVTHLGDNFSAGGYARVTYSVTVATAGTYAVRYTVDQAGSAVNTVVDGTSSNQIVVGAGSPVTTRSFVLGAGTHTIGTQSPDGYGSVGIDLVRVG